MPRAAAAPPCTVIINNPPPSPNNLNIPVSFTAQGTTAGTVANLAYYLDADPPSGFSHPGGPWQFNLGGLENDRWYTLTVLGWDTNNEACLPAMREFKTVAAVMARGARRQAAAPPRPPRVYHYESTHPRQLVPVMRAKIGAGSTAQFGAVLQARWHNPNPSQPDVTTLLYNGRLSRMPGWFRLARSGIYSLTLVTFAGGSVFGHANVIRVV